MEWAKFIKTYWRSILIVLCLIMMYSSYGKAWGTEPVKTADSITVYYDQNHMVDHQETTHIGGYQFYGHPIDGTSEAVAQVLLVVIVAMYWLKKSRKAILIPFFILFLYILIVGTKSGGGDGAQQFFFALVGMGIAIFTRKFEKGLSHKV